jgi:23S rRNA (adenine2503-C2)-methyltransferase
MGAVKPDLRSLDRDATGRLVAELGEKPFRARQLFRWLHQKCAASVDEMTDLPASLREALKDRTVLPTLVVEREQRSHDGTIKWKWRTTDGKFLESVYLPETGRKTLCVSTQVGCAMGCTFCLTATMGLVRNLSPSEIVDQVHRANRRLRELGEGKGLRPLTNIVFMGMGEPLHNYENLKAALAILLAEDGPNFSHRHVTVSTSGLVPEMLRLGAETEVKLAVSLNATTDALRDEIMPIGKRWDIAALMKACREFPMKRGRRITFEYVLLGGVNDADADAKRLATLVKGVPAKVNLIPYNPNPGLAFEAPAPERVAAFQEILIQRGITARTGGATSPPPAASSPPRAGPAMPGGESSCRSFLPGEASR